MTNDIRSGTLAISERWTQALKDTLAAPIAYRLFVMPSKEGDEHTGVVDQVALCKSLFILVLEGTPMLRQSLDPLIDKVLSRSVPMAGQSPVYLSTSFGF